MPAPGKSATGNRFLFTGREYFASVGLYNYRNRFYSPKWGRFLQSDPIGFAGDPANLYRYVGNNPVNWSDPYGLDIRVVEYFAGSYGINYNHVGVGVTGSFGTQSYYSQSGSIRGPGMVKADDGVAIMGRDVTIPTTMEQDAAANSYIDAVKANPQTYTIYNNNCTRFVEGALKAAGLENVPNVLAPGSLIDALKKQYEKPPFSDVHVTIRAGVGGGGAGGLGGGSSLLGVGTTIWGGEPWGVGVPDGNVRIDWKKVKAYKKG
jgi:RHS repeat-associated protein